MSCDNILDIKRPDFLSNEYIKKYQRQAQTYEHQDQVNDYNISVMKEIQKDLNKFCEHIHGLKLNYSFAYVTKVLNHINSLGLTSNPLVIVDEKTFRTRILNEYKKLLENFSTQFDFFMNDKNEGQGSLAVFTADEDTAYQYIMVGYVTQDKINEFNQYKKSITEKLNECMDSLNKEINKGTTTQGGKSRSGIQKYKKTKRMVKKNVKKSRKGAL